MKRKNANALSVDTSLHLDWATHEAAKYAVENWHYSKTMPVSKLIKVGVWEGGDFIGVIIFSPGANNNMGKPFGLSQFEVCELTRVALHKHKTPVSRIIKIALKMVKRLCPKLRLIISYADPEEGHYGGIYQAGGWVFSGVSQAQREVIVDGKIMHKRTANAKFGTIKGLEKSKILFKLKYLMPLNEQMKKYIEPLRKPYPKREKQGNEDFQSLTGGATPTLTLQTSEEWRTSTEHSTRYSR